MPQPAYSDHGGRGVAQAQNLSRTSKLLVTKHRAAVYARYSSDLQRDGLDRGPSPRLPWKNKLCFFRAALRAAAVVASLPRLARAQRGPQDPLRARSPGAGPRLDDWGHGDRPPICVSWVVGGLQPRRRTTGLGPVRFRHDLVRRTRPTRCIQAFSDRHSIGGSDWALADMAEVT
jgi:hypothetical protein